MLIIEFKNKVLLFVLLVAACLTTPIFTITEAEALHTLGLGLGENATKEQIEKAYRRLAFKYHPDRNHADKTAEAFMAKINEAREYFKEAEKQNAALREVLKKQALWERSNHFELAGQLSACIGVAVLMGSVQKMYDEYYAYHNKDKKWHEIFTWTDYVSPTIGIASIIAAIICLHKAEILRKAAS